MQGPEDPVGEFGQPLATVFELLLGRPGTGKTHHTKSALRALPGLGQGPTEPSCEDEVLYVEHPALKEFNGEAYARLLADVIERTGPMSPGSTL